MICMFLGVNAISPLSVISRLLISPIRSASILAFSLAEYGALVPELDAMASFFCVEWLRYSANQDRLVQAIYD